MPAKNTKAAAPKADVLGLAESCFPYFLRKGKDGDDAEAARLSIEAAETFSSCWDDHLAAKEAAAKAAAEKEAAAKKAAEKKAAEKK